MDQFRDIAQSYDSTWKASLGFSGQSKEWQGNQITNAPQKTFFGNFSIKYLSRSRSSSSCSTDSTASTNSSHSSEVIAAPTHLGKEFRTAIASKYGEAVAAAIDKQFSLSSATQLSEKEISKIIKAADSPTLVAKLNQNDWKTIEKTITSKDSGLQSDYYSTMVPTAEILSASYKNDGVKGVCSRDYKNPNHSINAWSDTLKSADGRTLFACVRSGVMAVLDPTKQESTFDARLNENILTALYTRNGKLPEKGNDEKNPIELSLVDIGLLSCYSVGINEVDLQTAQFNLIDAANGKKRAISYIPPSSNQPITIYVKPIIKAVNIGVNVGDSLSIPNANKTDSTIRSILDEATTLLENSNKTMSSTDRRVIQELYDQCKEMHAQKIYLTENEGDYCAFHARFALLCFKMGYTPMFHCRSGSNRTARGIEETKFLTAELNDNIRKEFQGHSLHKNLVRYSGKLSAARQKTAAAFFVGLGTLEVQKVNSGDSGSLQHYLIAKRIPNETDAIKKYQGVYGSLLRTFKKLYGIFIFPPK